MVRIVATFFLFAVLAAAALVSVAFGFPVWSGPALLAFVGVFGGWFTIKGLDR